MERYHLDPDSIGVVGAGTMGHGIAAAFLCEGYHVSIHDIEEEMLEQARQGIDSILGLFVNEGMIDEAVASEAEDRIQYSTDLEQVVADTDLVLEAVSEDMEVKRAVFEDINRYAPAEAVLASNTSGLSITEIASVTDRPERVVGAHWFNPPHIVPLVEVIKGERTDDDIAEGVAEFLERIGKTAVVVNKDVPGYIGNRIQMAMCYEAFSLLERGVASAEDIDKAVQAGFGFRLPSMGIFEKVDQSGLDVHHAVEEYLMPDLDRGTDPNPVVTRLVEEGDLGLKTGRGVYDWEGSDPTEVEGKRDEELLELLRVYESGLTDPGPGRDEE